MVGTAGLDRLMLARIPDEEHAILGAEPVQQGMHLPRARETRFVDHVKTSRAIRRVPWLEQMPLQGLRGDPRISQTMGGAGSRREPVDAVAVALGRGPD